MPKIPPIQVNHLFPILDDKLIELLSSLTEEEWHHPTIAKQWCVKDIAAHLLDGNLRGLSLQRDGYFGDPPPAINGYADLLAYLNRLNADWVTAMKRVSPPVLLSLLQLTGKAYTDTLTALPPFEQALFSVGWAGEETSPNWFHTAREYTERFIHQQQIRDAVGRLGILTAQLFRPFIDTFMQGMPHLFRGVDAPTGTVVGVTISTDAGGSWFIVRGGISWTVSATDPSHPLAASVTLDPDTAWKLFSKGIRPEEAMNKVQITGNAALGRKVLELVAVMA